MHWLLLATPVLAAGADEALEARFRESLQAAGDSVVVCAAGEAAERQARRALDQLGVEVPILRVATVGSVDRELDGCRASASARCALHVYQEASGDTRLDLSGDCTRPADAPAAPEIASDAAPEAAPEVTTATSDEAPPADPAPVDWEARRRRYGLESLDITDPTLTGPDAPPWVVRRGSGALVSATDLAETLGDADTTRRLQDETDAARRRSRLLKYVGWGLVALSPTPFLFAPTDREQSEDRVWTGVVFAGTGALCLVASPLVHRDVGRRQRQPAGYYSQEAADEQIQAYNRALYRRLELDQAPPPEAEAAPEPAPVPAPPAEAPPAEPAPAAPAPADEATPSPEPETPPVRVSLPRADIPDGSDLPEGGETGPTDAPDEVSP